MPLCTNEAGVSNHVSQTHYYFDLWLCQQQSPEVRYQQNQQACVYNTPKMDVATKKVQILKQNASHRCSSWQHRRFIHPNLLICWTETCFCRILWCHSDLNLWPFVYNISWLNLYYPGGTFEESDLDLWPSKSSLVHPQVKVDISAKFWVIPSWSIVFKDWDRWTTQKHDASTHGCCQHRGIKTHVGVWLSFDLRSLKASIHHSQCDWMVCGVNLVARPKAVSTISELWNV